MISLFFSPLLWLPLLGIAWWILRRTRDLPGPLSPSDRRWRQAAVVVLGLFVAGFGVCGAFGTVAGIGTLLGNSGGEARGYAVMFAIPGLIGLGLAALGVWLLRKHRRLAESKPMSLTERDEDALP
jgi:hypothetical protein